MWPTGAVQPVRHQLQALFRRNRAPVVGVLAGYPSADAGQKVVKLGPGEAEVPLKANLILTQLLEQMVKFTKLRTLLQDGMNSKTSHRCLTTPFSGFLY